MKKTQLLELWRSIRKSPISFLSIIIITALGVMEFCGIAFAGAAVTNMGEQYYQNANFYDLRLFSPTGFDEEDFEQMQAVEGVAQISAGYVTQQLISIKDVNLVAEIFTQSETINLPNMKEGRLPQTKNECTIELPLAKRFDLKVGDVISFASRAGSTEKSRLLESEFTVVGIAELPLVLYKDDYFNRGVSALGDGQVGTLMIVDESAFNMDMFLDIPTCYVKTTGTQSIFSQGYKDEIAQIRKRIGDIGAQREAVKFEARRAEYETKHADAKKEYQTKLDAYNDALQKLDAGKAELDQKNSELLALQQKLSTAQIEEKRALLAKKQAELDAGYQQLAEKEPLLQNAGALLEAAKAKLESLEQAGEGIAALAETYLAFDPEGKLSIWSSSVTDGVVLNFKGLDFTPIIADGNFPTSDEECAIEGDYAEQNNLKIGDFYELEDGRKLKVSGIYQISSSGTPEQDTTEKELHIITFLDDKEDSLVKLSFNAAYYVHNDNFFLQEYRQNKDEIKKAMEGSYEVKGNLIVLDVKNAPNSFANYTQSLRQQYNEKNQEYAAGLEQYNTAKRTLDEASVTLAQMRETLTKTVAEIGAATAKLNEGLKIVKEGYVTWEQKQAELQDAQKQLNEGKLLIEEGERSFAKLSQGRWAITGVESNASYHSFTTNLGGMTSVAYTCCILLLVIATLVSYTTIGRMVSDQRRLIGTQRALGLKPREIYGKYIAYAFLSTSCGIILGVITAYGVMQYIVYNISYAAAYQAKNFVPAFVLEPVLIIAGGSLACSILAAVISSRQLVRQSAVTLLNAATSEIKHKSTSVSKRLPLNFVMAMRNIMTNKKVLLTTIAGVAGSTILLIVVFTVRAGMGGVPNRQYRELQHYDGTVVINGQAEPAAQDELHRYLAAEGGFGSLPVCERYNSFLKDGDYHYATLLSSEQPELTNYLSLIDTRTGSKMEIPEEGVLLSKKCAEEYGYSVGDEFVITDSKGATHKTFIAGIFERNIGNAFVVNPKYYYESTGEKLLFNQYLIQLNEMDRDDFLAQLSRYPALVNYAPADLYVDVFNDKLSRIDSAVLVILIVTLLISVSVLSNLAIMNITQKETEITVMRALGMPLRHINGYVLREVMLMSFIGLLIGVLLGAPIGAFVTRAIELEGIQNIRGINFLACLAGAGICTVFFTASNLLSLIKIKDTKMIGTVRQA